MRKKWDISPRGERKPIIKKTNQKLMHRKEQWKIKSEANEQE